MPRKRKPAELVRRAAENEGLVSAPVLPVPRIPKDQVIAFVEPATLNMLKKLKAVTDGEINGMLAAVRSGATVDATGQKIRNLASTLQTMQATEKEALDDEALGSMSDEELVKQLRDQASAIEARLAGNFEEDL